jgi:hypothetical protein
MADHRFRSWSIRFLAAALACVSTACAPADATEPCASLKAAIAAGHPSVLIVGPMHGGTVAKSEAYADYSAYRDDFVRAHEPGLCLFSLDAASYRTRIAAPALKNAFATLFVRDAAHVLYTEGMILEPQIYVIGARFLKQGATEGGDYGLRETALGLR